MVITLIGYRGSGKTTVARALAERLAWNWIDADTVVEQTAGQTIREIFAVEGEPGFRRRERTALVELLTRDKLVLAAGGGAVLNLDTRREMQSAGPVVWLQASVPVLAARIAADPGTAQRRPNLAGGGTEEIAKLLAEREPLYRDCASLTIGTDGLSVTDIVDRIAASLALPTRGPG
jgi:shikimate kinase